MSYGKVPNIGGSRYSRGYCPGSSGRRASPKVGTPERESHSNVYKPYTANLNIGGTPHNIPVLWSGVAGSHPSENQVPGFCGKSFIPEIKTWNGVSYVEDNPFNRMNLLGSTGINLSMVYPISFVFG